MGAGRRAVQVVRACQALSDGLAAVAAEQNRSPIVCFSGRAYPELSRDLRAFRGVAGRCRYCSGWSLLLLSPLLSGAAGERTSIDASEDATKLVGGSARSVTAATTPGASSLLGRPTIRGLPRPRRSTGWLGQCVWPPG